MRYSSSIRSGVALLLCAVLPWQWFFPGISGAGGGPPEDVLLLKYAAPDIPEAAGREILAPIQGWMEKELSVRFVSTPSEQPVSAEGRTPYPLPEDDTLRRISEGISDAARRMEMVEYAEALLLLDEAERDARACRFTEATRPLLAEIFLRKGILDLWKGNLSGAEDHFSRSRALRPGFTPDPALFSPQFLTVWDAARSRPAPEAELLVQSLPPGAGISVDGERRGVTPARIHPGKPGPVTLRLSLDGYRDAEITGQWLPGDKEILSFTLQGDRIARLGTLLSGASREKGEGSGGLLREIVNGSGAKRVAIVAIEKRAGGEGYVARIYTAGPGSGDLAMLGETEIPPGDAGARAAGRFAAGKLLAAGWPKTEGREAAGRPWYNSWWFWAAVIATAGIAAVAAGGGGSSSPSGSTVAVNF